MINLSGNFSMIEGVPVGSDYNDPYQYFYFPNRPHLAVDEGRPAIRLLVYKEDLDELTPDEESVAGFLYFDTSLSWPEETLKKVAQQIQEDQNLDHLPRLTPLLFKSGTVHLIFLDKKTLAPGEQPPDGDGTDTVADSPEAWVISLESSGIPSLYGENRAIFSAVLTKQATQLMYDAFEGFIPAGVVYDLDFIGMQRAFNVRVTADWEQVYHYFQERFGLDLMVFKVQTDKIVEELIEKKIITIEASIEGVGDEGMENEFNAVRRDLQELVLDKFFKPAPNPNHPDTQPITGTLVDFLRDLRDLGHPNVGFTRRELDVSEIRTIAVDYTIDRAVERKIAPQAHLSLFFEDFGLTREDVITVVNGSDDFFKEVDFNVSANADFTGDGLFGLSVDVAYGQRDGSGGETNSPAGEPEPTWSFLLDQVNPVARKSAWYDPEAGRQFQYRYHAIFSPQAIPGPEDDLDSGWLEHNSNVLVVSANKLYRKRSLAFELAKDFPLELYPQVQIQVRYADPETGWAFSDGLLLDEEEPSGEIDFRTRLKAPIQVEYYLTFVHASGPVESGWQSTEADLVLIQDPRPNLYRVSILVAGDRSKIQDLLLDFRYEDPENDVFESKFIHIQQTNINDPFEWTFAPADPACHRYSYNQTLLDTDGELLVTGWVQAEKPVLPVGIVYAKRWEVQPELVGPSLADNGLEKIKLTLHYEDSANDVSLEKQMIFAAPGKGEVWQLELQDPSARQYTYELSYVLQNGFERKSGPFTSTDTFLIVSSVPPVQ